MKKRELINPFDMGVCSKKLNFAININLSSLLPTTLSKGGSVDPLLTHEPFALTTSNLVGH